MPDLEIIGVPFSNYVRSIRMLCEEKGVAYKLTPLRPHTPEVNAIHPAGQIPCMRHGDVSIFESKAIATYVDKAFPGARFIPEDAVGAAMVEQWVSYGNVKVDRWIMREFVVPSVFFDKAKGPDTARIDASLPEIGKCAKVLDEAVARTGYLAGSGLTYADMNVIPMLATGQGFPAVKEVLAKHSNLTAYIARLTERSSYRNTAPPPRA
ncbi:MAG: glutathione S-transferase family protein [Hyphomicrobiaceae bacterium]|nr:glutathione S-transferase family protein [Hyphomicrobiaceae bacterium]